MNSLAGKVVDILDDLSLLKNEKMPIHVKMAAAHTKPITSGDFGHMSEDDFALVFLTKEGHYIPKYPVHDKFHTWAADVAFNKTASQLPPASRVIAATFIKRACDLYGISPSKPVSMLAEPSIDSNVYDVNDPPSLHKMAMTDAVLRALTPEQRKIYRDAQDLSSDGANTGLDPRALKKVLDAPSGPQEMWNPKVQVDPAEVDGVHAELETKQRINDEITETKMAMLAPRPQEHMRVRLMEKAASMAPDHEYGLVVDGQRHFPMFTVELTKQANDFFEQHYTELYPKFRRDFAVKIAFKCNQYGMPVPSSVEKYASAGYSNQLGLHMHARKLCLPDPSSHAVLDTLYEKRASMHPQHFAEVLEDFDRSYGIDRHWDVSIPDPYMSTTAKVAQADWYYENGDQRMTLDELNKLAEDPSPLHGYMPDEVIQEFQKNAQAIFDSMPTPQKNVFLKAAKGSLEKRAYSQDRSDLGKLRRAEDLDPKKRVSRGGIRRYGSHEDMVNFEMDRQRKQKDAGGKSEKQASLAGANRSAMLADIERLQESGSYGGQQFRPLAGKGDGFVEVYSPESKGFLGFGASPRKTKQILKHSPGGRWMEVAVPKAEMQQIISGLESGDLYFDSDTSEKKAGKMIGHKPGPTSSDKPILGGSKATKPVIPFGPDVSGVQMPSSGMDDSTTKAAGCADPLLPRTTGAYGNDYSPEDLEERVRRQRENLRKYVEEANIRKILSGSLQVHEREDRS